MANNFKIGTPGLELIKSFEGFRAKTYTCSAGKLTIGYGSTGRLSDGTIVKPGMTITKERATAELINYCNGKSSYVNSLMSRQMKQNEFDALMAIVYNLGSLKNCETLRGALQGNNPQAIKDAWLAICKARNKKTKKLEVLGGLLRRRKAEVNLFFTGTSNTVSQSDMNKLQGGLTSSGNSNSNTSAGNSSSSPQSVASRIDITKLFVNLDGSGVDTSKDEPREPKNETKIISKAGTSQGDVGTKQILNSNIDYKDNPNIQK